MSDIDKLNAIQARRREDQLAQELADLMEESKRTIASLREERDQLRAALADLVEVNERIGAPKITKGGLCEENDWHYDMRKAKAALNLAKEGQKI